MSNYIPQGAAESVARNADKSRFNAVAVSIAGDMPQSDPVRVHGTGAYWKIQLSPRDGSGIHCQHSGGYTRDNVSSYASYGSYRCLTFAELADAMEAGDLLPQWSVGISL
jgi:hypothetical protein